MAAQAPLTSDTLITIKVQLATENRRFKLPLRDLGANTLPEKLRALLALPPTKAVVFERYSDSAGSYIKLDSDNPAIYKQLFRAARAKLKLRIRANVSGTDEPVAEVPKIEPVTQAAAASDLVEQLRLLAQAQATATGTPDESIAKSIAVPASATSEPIGNIKQGEEAEAEAEAEAPVSRPFSERDQFFAELASLSNSRPALAPPVGGPLPASFTSFTVCCNNCKADIPGPHWHCSVCDQGDFDLCRHCINGGAHCEVEHHFLIKRSIEDGKVVNSTIETVPKKIVEPVTEKGIPDAFTTEIKEQHLSDIAGVSRTCNCCINVYDESNFVTCTVCEDYDLCLPCHVGLKHGHHPNHAFVPVSEDLHLDATATLLCEPGRNMRHFAVCDGCDKDIYGVRHKCLSCPDWDYCSACFKSVRQIHPGHRFVPVYGSFGEAGPACSQIHRGVYCDGPLCNIKPAGQTWIVGIRYKCAVCHDTDFCANCEALPTNTHNRTHPLIKFRTPVRNVSVTTFNEKDNGATTTTLGDRSPQTRSKSTETMPVAPSANAATQVQTVVEVKPVEPIKEEPIPEKMIKEEPIPEKVIKEEPIAEKVIKEEAQTVRATAPPALKLEAHYINDIIADGTQIRTGDHFKQTWLLHNPGPSAWPVGCSLSYVGGDNNMLDVDQTSPASNSVIDAATRSNLTSRTVEVGEDVSFTVNLKAPMRLGKAISYWRLKTFEGSSFGHRLWCDIEVVEPVPAGGSEWAENVEKMQESQMVFPTLDKESPASSTHQALAEEEEEEEDGGLSTSPPSMAAEERELLEDIERLAIEDDETTDDEFLTDEEYEFLDTEDDGREAMNGRK